MYALLLLLGLLWGPPHEPYDATVVAITDGDTVVVLKDKVQIKVRLSGIDAPEKRQPFGTVARSYLGELAQGQLVQVAPVNIDRYGRTVAALKLPDGRIINEEMVRSGFAWWYRQYPSQDKTLEGLEDEARIAKRGLWSHADPEPPWEFRRRTKAK